MAPPRTSTFAAHTTVALNDDRATLHTSFDEIIPYASSRSTARECARTRDWFVGDKQGSASVEERFVAHRWRRFGVNGNIRSTFAREFTFEKGWSRITKLAYARDMRTFVFFLFGLGVSACGGGDSAEVEITPPMGSSSSSSGGEGGQGGTGVGGASTGGGGMGGGGVSPACMGKSPMAAGNTDYQVMTSGEARDYRVHVPPGYTAEKPVALVVALHGYTEKIDEYMEISHFAEAVDQRGMIVVFPQGKAPLGVPGWNAGTCCGTAQTQKTPDVQFIRDMVAKIEQDYCIDPQRIFASGFSNGGMLSHRLACELSERIAAIGAVSGTMAIDPCVPKRQVPILHIHGTSDIVVPYNNSITAQTVPQTIGGWTTRNFCKADKSTVYSKGSVSCELYTACNADVELCTIEGGSHQWPGGGAAMGMGDLDATAYILDFFDAHPMP